MGVRLRFTFMYVALFLASGLGLLAIVALVSVRSTTQATQSGNVPPEQQIAELNRQLADMAGEQTRRIYLGLVAALAMMMLVSLVLGRVAAGRVLRPLRRITAATRRVTADNLHSRLALKGPADEVKALADTIDDLLGRLEDAFAAQRRFVADASHELRTPLTTLRASVDVSMAKPSPPPEVVVLGTRVRASLDQLETLLEGLLVLARAQHGALDDREPVSVASLIEQDWSGQDFVAVGNRVLLARMISNVIGNAVRHNVPGGWVRVRLSSGVAVVENSGPVLTPEEVARLGQPFYGRGTGLGLAIATAIATAHGGSLTLAARGSGGLRVEIQFPR